jgi:hypothetical protein
MYNPPSEKNRCKYMTEIFHIGKNRENRFFHKLEEKWKMSEDNGCRRHYKMY